MAISTQACGAVILAGGASRRMGRSKALLCVEGQTMLERTRRCLSEFDEIILSANDPSMAGDMIRVKDRYPGSGPLGGLHAALCRTEKEALFCVPCDLPRFSPKVPRLLLDAMPEDGTVLICRDSTGRFHPLCGIYRKEVLPVLEQCLSEGRYKVMDLVRRVPHAWVDTAGVVPDETFFNMNTPEDYRRACLNRE